MKSDLKILEECLEAKTKEYQLALLQTSASDSPWSSFVDVSGYVSQKVTIDRLRSEILQLQALREEMLRDIVEQEVMSGNKEDIIKYLTNSSDGTYRLIRVEGKSSASQ